MIYIPNIHLLASTFLAPTPSHPTSVSVKDCMLGKSQTSAFVILCHCTRNVGMRDLIARRMVTMKVRIMTVFEGRFVYHPPAGNTRFLRHDTE